MVLTVSKLRENIYKVLDQVLTTGIPVEIRRRGKSLRLIRSEESSTRKLDQLVERPDYLHCKPESLVHLDWSKRAPVAYLDSHVVAWLNPSSCDSSLTSANLDTP